MTQLLLRDLPPGQDYLLQLRSRNDTMVSQWSTYFPIHTISDTIPPSAPTGFDFTISGTTFTAKWDAVTTNDDSPPNITPSPCTDLDHYEVTFDNGTIQKTRVTHNLEYVMDLAENRALFGEVSGSITAWVNAVDTTGNKSTDSVHILAENPRPAAPAYINVTGVANGIFIEWAAVPEEDINEYILQIGESNTGPWSTIYRGPNTNFQFLSLEYGTTFYFQAAAIDGFNTIGYYVVSEGVSPVNGSSTDLDSPDAPDNVTVTTGYDLSVQSTYLDVSWDAVTADDLAAYLVRYSPTGSNYVTIRVPKTSTTQRIYVDQNTNYYTAVAATDYSGNTSAFTNASTYPILSDHDVTAPSKPNEPAVAANTMKIQVTVDGFKDDGTTPMETDVILYKVYASTSSGFTPSDSNLLGTINVGPAMVNSWPVPASGGSSQTWYAKIIAVDEGGLSSPASGASSASVPLIQSTNIENATITYANIHDVNADQIEAGDGFINDLTVKSTFTLGASGEDGTIQSYDYDPGDTGFKLSTTGLEINEGDISASALRIQNSPNLMPGAYASFELDESYYINADGSLRGLTTDQTADATFGIDITTYKFGLQSFKVDQTAATARRVWLSNGSANNNIFMTPDGSKYFFSFWVKPSVTNALTATIANGATTISTQTLKRTMDDSTTLTVGAWQQVYLLTSALSLDSVNASISFPAVIGTWYIDGVQFERLIGTSTKPGVWVESGTTEITGNMIKTGSIASSATGFYIDPITGARLSNGEPAWSIDLDGDANFGDLKVNGTVIVGNIEDDEVTAAGKTVQSANYLPNSLQGWALYGDGSAVFNNIRTGSLDATALKDGSVTSQQIGEVKADLITTGTMNSDVAISGSFYTELSGLDIPDTTDPDLAQVVIDPSGIRVIQSDGTDGTVLGSDGTSTFSGIVNAEVLNVDDALRLSGDDNLVLPTGVINLSSKTARPRKPPKPTITWDTTTIFDPTLNRTIRSVQYDSTNDLWIIVSTTPTTIYFDNFDPDFTNQVELTNYYIDDGFGEPITYSWVGGCVIGGEYYVADDGGDYTYITRLSDGAHFINMKSKGGDYAYSKIGTDGTNVLISEMNSSNHPTIFVIDPATAPGTSIVAGGTEVNPTIEGSTSAARRFGWTAGTGCALAESSSFAHSGTYSLKSYRTSSSGTAYLKTAKIGVSGRTRYNVRFWYKATVDTPVTAYAYYYNSSGNFIGLFGGDQYVATGSWQQLEFQTEYAPPSTTDIVVQFQSTSNVAQGNGIYIDDLEIDHTEINWSGSQVMIDKDYGDNGYVNGFLPYDTYMAGNRYMFGVTYKPGSTTYKIVDSFSSTPTLQDAERFTQPWTIDTVTALGYDGSYAYSFSANKVAKHEDITWGTGTSSTWWYGHTWFDSVNSYQTPVSPLVSFTMQKRARVVLTAPPIPNHGLSGDPDSVRFFLGRGSTAPSTTTDNVVVQYNASQPAPGFNTLVLFNPIFTASGTTSLHYGGAHLGSDFPAVTNPGSIKSTDDGTGYITLKGDGSGRVGPMSWNSTGVRTSDTGWQTPTAISASGLNSTAVSACRIKMVDGQWVEIMGRVTLGTTVTIGAGGLVASGGFEFMQMPSSHTPGTGGRYGTCVTSDTGNTFGVVIIGTDGKVSLERCGAASGSLASSTTINFSLFYML